MSQIFKLKTFSPVGYVLPEYSNKLCICRNPLYEKCVECVSNKSDIKCTVVKNNDNYLHDHCNILYSKNM